MPQTILRLYRCCTKRDYENGYVLSSNELTRLDVNDTLQELVSHILHASQRNIYYSFTPSLSLAKEYKKRNPQNVDICYVDLDLKNLPDTVIGIFPVFSRRFWLNLIASSDDALANNYIEKPENSTKHSLLGIVNCSQRTVSSWAFSMREFTLQVNNLKLKVLKDEDDVVSVTDETLERIVNDLFIEQIDKDNVSTLRALFHKEFEACKLKRKYVIDLVDSEKWFAA